MAELIAGNAFVLTACGPAAAAALEPDSDELWVVTRNGGLALTGLRTVSELEPRRLWRLLTSVGDITLPDGAFVSTDGGRFLTGNEVHELVQHGERVDVDAISPGDVGLSAATSMPTSDVIRYALAHLPHETIVIPVANGAAKAVEAAIESMLESADIEFRRSYNDRWLTFALEDLPASSPFARQAFSQQADALLLATAWELNGTGFSSRVRLNDPLLLQSLIGSLVGAGRPFDVKWAPKYSPVECRVRVVEEPPWGAFVAVDAVAREAGPVFDLDLEGSGRPIVGLAVTTSRL